MSKMLTIKNLSGIDLLDATIWYWDSDDHFYVPEYQHVVLLKEQTMEVPKSEGLGYRYKDMPDVEFESSFGYISAKDSDGQEKDLECERREDEVLILGYKKK